MLEIAIKERGNNVSKIITAMIYEIAVLIGFLLVLIKLLNKSYHFIDLDKHKNFDSKCSSIVRGIEIFAVLGIGLDLFGVSTVLACVISAIVSVIWICLSKEDRVQQINNEQRKESKTEYTK